MVGVIALRNLCVLEYRNKKSCVKSILQKKLQVGYAAFFVSFFQSDKNCLNYNTKSCKNDN